MQMASCCFRDGRQGEHMSVRPMRVDCRIWEMSGREVFETARNVVFKALHGDGDMESDAERF